jgi:hypothetical protein
MECLAGTRRLVEARSTTASFQLADFVEGGADRIDRQIALAIPTVPTLSGRRGDVILDAGLS